MRKIDIITKIVIVNMIIMFTLILFIGTIALIHFIINFNLIGLSLSLSNLAIISYLLYIFTKDKVL